MTATALRSQMSNVVFLSYEWKLKNIDPVSRSLAISFTREFTLQKY